MVRQDNRNFLKYEENSVKPLLHTMALVTQGGTLFGAKLLDVCWEGGGPS